MNTEMHSEIPAKSIPLGRRRCVVQARAGKRLALGMTLETAKAAAVLAHFDQHRVRGQT